MNQQAAVATDEEIAAQKRRCWSPPCKGRAFLVDWAGWHWCFKHWYQGLRGQYLDYQTMTSVWFWIKHTRVY